MRGDTAIGHVDAHNELRSGILREAERFGTTVDIGGPYQVNDPGHVQEHDKTRKALESLADTAGITVTLPPARKLGDHEHSPSDHDLLDQALDVISKASAWNDATGGTITDYTKDGIRYRVHTFTSSGNFITRIAVKPFRVLVVGGAGGGGARSGEGSIYAGGGGGGGGVLEKSLPFSVGTFLVTVGEGRSGQNARGLPSIVNGLEAGGGLNGQGWGNGQNGSESGTPSTHGGGSNAYVFNGGGGGGAGGGGGGSDESRGGAGGGGLVSDITGANSEYGRGGKGGDGSTGCAGLAGSGAPGSQNGIVIISYQIGVVQ